MAVADRAAGAGSIRLGRLLLTALAAVLFSLGWCAAKVVLALAWAAAAMHLGWLQARALPEHGER